MATGKYGDSRAIDVSDWGRPIARFFAKRLEKTPVSVLMVTHFHLFVSIFCAWLILEEMIVEGCIVLVIKGVIDAINKIRGPISEMGEKNQNTSMQYILNLSKLSKLYSEC